LRERLKQQVDAIRDAAFDSPASRAALELLALVSFASALGARLDVASLCENFPGTDLGRIVERLESEHLVRRVDQGLQLDGLHPVRSRLLADILCDGITFDPQVLAQRCLDLIWDEDTEVFLLHLASRHADLMPSMVRHLGGWQPRTWARVGGVLRALLWWGAAICRSIVWAGRRDHGLERQGMAGHVGPYRYWLPPGLEHGQAVLSVEACTSWLYQVMAHSEALDMVVGAWVLDSLTQAAALPRPDEAPESVRL
jgi:hypothetical protein